MKINDEIEAEISGFDEKGRGKMKAGSKDALAYFAVPGDMVAGRISARTKGMLRVSLEKILKPSADRVLPPCPDAGKCGGCPWQMISYERQCAMKLELVNEALKQHGLSGICTVNDEGLVRATSRYHHRNRMDYVFAVDGSLGLKTPEHWDAVLDVRGCLMLSPEAMRIMDAVRRLTRESGTPFWNNRAHAGFWRYLVIREGKNTGERMVMLTTSAEQMEFPMQEEFIAALRPLATSFLWGINPDIADLSIPKTIHAFFGEPYLHEKVNGISYRIPAASFFQTNSEMAAELQKTAVEFAAPKKNSRILDLYCGSGFLSLGLAAAAQEVLGLEIDASAVESAKKNAELNGMTNVSFRAGAAEKTVATELASFNPDIIVMDPPRSGLHPSALAAVAGHGTERLVYVSCNPLSLCRDLVSLLPTYAIENIRCIDLFPHTPHIETVVSLKRK
jgi:23S rRNA (uracil1939-C5)-methyltransferase